MMPTSLFSVARVDHNYAMKSDMVSPVHRKGLLLMHPGRWAPLPGQFASLVVHFPSWPPLNG